MHRDFSLFQARSAAEKSGRFPFFRLRLPRGCGQNSSKNVFPKSYRHPSMILRSPRTMGDVHDYKSIQMLVTCADNLQALDLSTLMFCGPMRLETLVDLLGLRLLDPDHT
jgi:hypothetical protein